MEHSNSEAPDDVCSAPTVRNKSGPRYLADRLARKREIIRTDQAELFALLANDLIEAQRAMPRESQESPIHDLPDYERFTLGAYACGFVCGDMAPDFDISMAHRRPEEVLRPLTLPKLRHYVHTLLRTERHSFPYGPLQEAILSGALGIVARRLQGDATLRSDE